MTLVNHMAAALLLHLFSGLFQEPPALPDQIIVIVPGTYPVEEVIDIMQEQGVFISYSQSALSKKVVNVDSGQTTVVNLLESIFDLEKYEYLVRRNKILIVPRINKKIQKHTGSYFRQPDEYHFITHIYTV